MKRSEQLKTLSWEHHDALKFARNIKKGMSNGTAPERIANYAIFIVDTLLRPHFELEEASLVKRLSASEAQDIVVTQVLDDHQEFYRLVAAIGKGEGDLGQLLESLIDLLKRHVKWEEQRFFPFCERVLSEEQLNLISDELEQGHLPGEVAWDDPFWN